MVLILAHSYGGFLSWGHVTSQLLLRKKKPLLIHVHCLKKAAVRVVLDVKIHNSIAHALELMFRGE
jgi:hypothetical protein